MLLGFALFILQSGFWSSIPPMPTARQEVGVAAVEGRVYVVGGLDETGRGRDTVEIFDTKTGRWESGPALPVSIHHPNVAAVGNKIYVAGGYAGAAGLAAATLFELDIDQLAWTRKPDMPSARGAGAAVGYNGRLYVFGGERGVTVADAAVFDPATNSWSALAPMPTPRNHMGAAAVRGKIYVIGGRPGNLRANEVYEPLTGRWATKAPMPTGRSGHAVTSLNNVVFSFGGEGNPNSPLGTFAEMEAYSPDLDAWTALQPMPAPRHGIGAAVVGNRIFVPAGATVQGLGATSQSDFFVVRQELFIPQLVVGGGYATSIMVTNPDPSRVAEVTVSVAGANGAPLVTNLNGSPLSSAAVVVPPLASRTVLASEPASAPIRIGTVRIAGDARISAYATIRGVGSAVTVYPANPARNLILDVWRSSSSGTNTGVSIINVSRQTANATFTLHAETGEEALRTERTFAPGEQSAYFIDQLFPNLPEEFTGALSVRSTQQIVVAGVVFEAAGVVSVPVVPIE